ncbi:MAG TPA: ribosome silencing factor [Anaerolineae bacterium]|nr:ribosome silencing factor [Anaerolineae bacterium]HQH38944.1 ribosome silencing factor [Anaerolineae bacterium]
MPAQARKWLSDYKTNDYETIFEGGWVESLELVHRITEIIVDKQGEDILILDLQAIATFADYFVICSGTSRRQLDALQSALREGLKKMEAPIMPLSVEGTPDSGWILMDYNSVIVHLFDPEVRSFYNLEELWKKGRVVVHIQ